ncbi:hypothetical protein SDC9_50299 [bioreactor metagenome]|jgi:hypothetical protein|uniref:Uncharacterized protein n=1 Tax=bioreactor metagenome TaxID=1076179 RepID=A0A644WJQ9_9ZZZZ
MIDFLMLTFLCVPEAGGLSGGGLDTKWTTLAEAGCPKGGLSRAN